MSTKKRWAQVGTVNVEVRRLSALNLLKMGLLLSPYQTELSEGLKSQTLSSIVGEAIKLPQVPELAMRCLALLLDRDYDWLVAQMTADQLIPAIRELDQVNFGLVEVVGVVLRFVNPLS